MIDTTTYPQVLDKVQNRRLRVLFVCVGNACRSQMAEAFANSYGPDVIDAKSAGLLPARRIPSLVRLVMQEKGVALRPMAEPKPLEAFELARFDLIVNMSGHALPATPTPVLRVTMRDPDGKDEMVHRQVRDRMEAMMVDFIRQLRSSRMDRFEITRELALAATA